MKEIGEPIYKLTGQWKNGKEVVENISSLTPVKGGPFDGAQAWYSQNCTEFTQKDADGVVHVYRRVGATYEYEGVEK